MELAAPPLAFSPVTHPPDCLAARRPSRLAAVAPVCLPVLHIVLGVRFSCHRTRALGPKRRRRRNGCMRRDAKMLKRLIIRCAKPLECKNRVFLGSIVYRCWPVQQFNATTFVRNNKKRWLHFNILSFSTFDPSIAALIDLPGSAFSSLHS